MSLKREMLMIMNNEFKCQWCGIGVRKPEKETQYITCDCCGAKYACHYNEGLEWFQLLKVE